MRITPGQLKGLEDKELIAVFWSYEDVLCVAKNRGVEMTKEEAKDILYEINHSHDAAIGVNWDVIDCHLIDYVESRESPLHLINEMSSDKNLQEWEKTLKESN